MRTTLGSLNKLDAVGGEKNQNICDTFFNITVVPNSFVVATSSTDPSKSTALEFCTFFVVSDRCMRNRTARQYCTTTDPYVKVDFII